MELSTIGMDVRNLDMTGLTVLGDAGLVPVGLWLVAALAGSPFEAGTQPVADDNVSAHVIDELMRFL